MNIKIFPDSKNKFLFINSYVRYLISFCTLTIIFYFKLLFKNSSFIEFILILNFFILAYYFIVFIHNSFHLWFKKHTNKVIYSLFVLSYFSLIGRGSSLYFARLIQNKEGLLWSIDLSFALNHANSISKYSDFSQTLSLSGYQESYHFGPAILAGLLDKFSIINVQISTLVIIPLISATAFTIAVFLLTFSISKNFNISYLVTALVTFIPSLFLNYSSLIILPKSFFQFFIQLPFNHNVMQNSLMTGIAIFSAFSLLFYNSKFYLFSYSLILFAFVSKPQYSIAGLIILAIYYFLDKFDFNFKFLFKDFGKFVNPINQFLFSLISIFWLITLNSLNKDIKLEIASFSLVSNNYKYIINQIYNFKIDILKISLLLLFLFTAVSYLYKKFLNLKNINLKLSNKLLKLNLILLFTFPIVYLICITFPIISNVEIKESIDVINLYKELYFIDGYTFTANNIQILFFFKTLVVILTTINFLIYFVIKYPKSYKYLISFLLALISYSNLCLYDLVHNPSSSIPYDTANESKLLDALNQIPISNSIIITNDNFYPNRKEPFNATNLSALSKHNFFISNIRYSRQYLKPGILKRIQDNNNFFSQNWSQFHSLLMRKNNISHILIRKSKANSTINWFKYYQKIEKLDKVYENEQWIILTSL
tara:strand:- start:47778 stop:49733 length:1956 start_codon:yes stop_codon:yes gene_type:complete